MLNTNELFAFADRLEQTAVRMFELLDLPLKDDSHTVALCLLARTISNFEGALVLLQKSLVMEARILMRCCWENSFYIAKIAKDAASFVRKMSDDDKASKRAQGERLFEQGLGGEGEAGKELAAFLRALKGSGKSLNPKQIADTGGLSQGYIIYMTASGDAAHPTITALNRHIVEGPVAGIIDQLNIIPVADQDEVAQTLEFTCGALLGACYAVGETLGGSRAAPEVKERLSEFQRLKGVPDV